MRIPGLKRLRHSFTRLRAKRWGDALILGYHRIGPTSADPFGITVSPEHFAQQLAVLQAQMRAMGLPQLVSQLDVGPIPRRALAVTFDDGYADAMQAAVPMLQTHGIPSTVFVVSGNLGWQFWWDDLAEAVLTPTRLPERLHLVIEGKGRDWILSVDAQSGGQPPGGKRRDLLMALYGALLPLSREVREDLIREILAWAHMRPQVNGTNRTLTADELTRLADTGLVEVASHTQNHPVLASLAASEQQYEITESKRALEAILGRPVLGFSYPNGSLAKESAKLVRQAGFTYACTSVEAAVYRTCNRFLLPRLWVGDLDGDEFGKWLSQWLHEG